MKKIINKLRIVVLILGIGAVSSCDDYLNINDDPTQVANPDPAFTLTSGLVDIAYFHTDRYGRACSYWCQYITQAGNVAGFTSDDQYQVLPGDNAYQRDFTGVYSGPLQDLQYTSETATALGKDNTAAIAEFVKAYTFQSLVDMFDQVPYSQALNIAEFSTPVYDDGASIYADLIPKIDAAIATVDPRSGEIVNGDIVFGGDMDLWLAFANTLKLKIFLRQTQVNAAAAQAGVQSLDGATFLTEAAEVPFDQSNPTNRHPAEINDLNTQSFNAISATIGDYMLNRSDARADVYFRRPVEPDITVTYPHQFVPQATGNTITGPTGGLGFYSARGHFLIGTGSAFPYFSAAESYFLQAEAVARGWMTGDAEALYNAGVTASFESAGATMGTYLTAQAPYPTAGTFDQQLEAIMMEKWIALIRQPIEMWNEWKRTGYPGTSVIAANPASGPNAYSLLPDGVFPLRFPPIQREVDLNPNTPSLGAQGLAEPVFWDQ